VVSTAGQCGRPLYCKCLCEQAGLIAAVFALAVLHRQLIAAEAGGAVGQRNDDCGEEDHAAEAEEPAHPAPISAPKAEGCDAVPRASNWIGLLQDAKEISDPYLQKMLRDIAMKVKDAQNPSAAGRR
jgi:hypothetical protein